MSEKVTASVMEDSDDLKLKQLMGKHFQDLTQEPTPCSQRGEKAEPPQTPAEKRSCRKVMDATWAPVKPNSTESQQLVNCAKHTVLYGGISGLLFWWQQAGLLAPEAAWPSFIVLALLVGLKIGSCMAARG